MDSLKELRILNQCPNTKEDYMDLLNIRRISMLRATYFLKDKIFNETIAITLVDNQSKIEIHNCEFREGLFIRWEGKTEPKDYGFFVYKSEIKKSCNLTSYDIKKNIAIDLTRIEKLFISGRSERIDFFGSEIGILEIENEKCETLQFEQTSVSKYSLSNLNISQFSTDKKSIAITDYSKFILKSNQTISDVSEIYHKLVLQAARSIEEKRKVNYEIAKATSSNYLVLFGYFYNPKHVFYWMLGIISLFSVLYWLILGEGFDKAVYFSIYTFLTIGFGDIGQESQVLIKSILVFIEGFLGILYCSVFLASIINSSKK